MKGLADLLSYVEMSGHLESASGRSDESEDSEEDEAEAEDWFHMTSCNFSVGICGNKRKNNRTD